MTLLLLALSSKLQLKHANTENTLVSEFINLETDNVEQKNENN